MSRKIKRKDITLGVLGEVCACYEGCMYCPFYCPEHDCYILSKTPDMYRYDYMDEEVLIPEECFFYE